MAANDASGGDESDDLAAMINERVRLSTLQLNIPSSAITVLPNGKQALFLAPDCDGQNKQLSLQLMNLENNDGNEWGQLFDFSSISQLSTTLSLEQRLLRERQRMSSHGITSYTYHAPTSQVYFQYGPHLCIARIANANEPITQLHSVPVIKIGTPSLDAVGTRMDAKITADGGFMVFARNHDLWMTTTRPNLLADAQQVPAEIQLTFAQNISNDIAAGTADFINEEEFDRYTGYWLCDRYKDIDVDGQQYREYAILYLEADSRCVPTITIPSMDGVESHKWPRSGETNCKFKVKIVRIAVPIRCCASIQDEQPQKVQNVSVDSVRVRDYQLKQSIYASYDWIEYIVRAGWTQRDDECWVQYLDRAQMTSNVVLYKTDTHFTTASNDDYALESDESEAKQAASDAMDTDADASLKGDELFLLQGSPWINIHDGYKFLSQGVIWIAEHTGYKHLYFIPYPQPQDTIARVPVDEEQKHNNSDDARLVQQTMLVPSKCQLHAITSGTWAVEGAPFWFDANQKIIYFTGRRETHLESQLYCLAFDPENATKSDAAAIRQLTENGYFHHAKLDDINFKFFSTIYSSVSTPNQFAIFNMQKECVKTFALPYRGQPSALQYVQPILMEVENFPAEATAEQKADAEFKQLYTFSAAVWPAYDPTQSEPDKQPKSGGYPTIVQVYGGPHAQLLTNSWDRMSGNSRIQLWRTLGFTVATIDGRGSFHRGLAFEGRLKYRMGQIEIQDQVRLVEKLCELGYTDKQRVGITGYSYGGYMSLMALCQRPDVFKIGIAGAPVTMWELYDTGYTERYMGTPQKQSNAYEEGAVSKYVKQFPDEEGRVVIVHGLADENVHFYHTSKLINAMVKASKPYELKIFPGERHGIRKLENLLYYERFCVQRFQKMLMD